MAFVKAMQHKRVATKKKRMRSILSAHPEMLPVTNNGHSTEYRRFKDITNAIMTDMGGEPAEVRLQLIRRFSACCVMAELAEGRMVCGGEFDQDEHAKLISSLVRLANKIGLDRIPRDVSPTLDGYLNGRPTRARRSAIDDPDEGD